MRQQVDLQSVLAIDGQCTLTVHRRGRCYRANCGLHLGADVVLAAMYEGMNPGVVRAFVDAHTTHHEEAHPPFERGYGMGVQQHDDPLDGSWWEVTCEH